MHLHSGSSEGALPVRSGRRVPLNRMVAPLPRVAVGRARHAPAEGLRRSLIEAGWRRGT